MELGLNLHSLQLQGGQQGDGHVSGALSSLAAVDMMSIKARLCLVAANLQPAIYKRGAMDSDVLYDMGVRVPEWELLRVPKGKGSQKLRGQAARAALRHAQQVVQAAHQLAMARPTMTMPVQLNPMPKLSRAVKTKANAAGRQYTSKFRGVHQTFPTKRWEAQFRRNGKPTSLGCFDHEEQAARAYDKMMLWCELHNTTGVKGGITNYDAAEYDKDLGWLQGVTQDELIDALRSDGRKQAAARMMRTKRDPAGIPLKRKTGSRDMTSERDYSSMGDESGGEGGVVDGAPASGEHMALDTDASHLLGALHSHHHHHHSHHHDPLGQGGRGQGVLDLSQAQQQQLHVTLQQFTGDFDPLRALQGVQQGGVQGGVQGAYDQYESMLG